MKIKKREQLDDNLYGSMTTHRRYHDKALSPYVYTELVEQIPKILNRHKIEALLVSTIQFGIFNSLDMSV